METAPRSDSPDTRASCDSAMPTLVETVLGEAVFIVIPHWTQPLVAYMATHSRVTWLPMNTMMFPPFRLLTLDVRALAVRMRKYAFETPTVYDENLDHGDWVDNGNVGEDVNMDVDDDIEENNSELISGSHNACDYYGESDTERDLEEESVDAPDYGESQSSVNMNEVTKDEGKENVQDSTHADDQRDMFMKIREMTFVCAEAAFAFYNSYAKDNGFNIRKDKWLTNFL
ncbi:Far1 [Hordeum vulgare]|nr:Far1 [Hordeum vulgare]